MFLIKKILYVGAIKLYFVKDVFTYSVVKNIAPKAIQMGLSLFHVFLKNKPTMIIVIYI